MAPEGRRDPKSTKKRPEWFPVARVMAKTNSSFFFPKNSTKFGKAGVSFAKIAKRSKNVGVRPKKCANCSLAHGYAVGHLHNEFGP
jgi:hypothetical protein